MTTLYSAPIDANFRLMPRKVFKEHAAPLKNFLDRDCGNTKDVFIEDGKRRVPRGRGQPSTSRNTLFEKLAADAAAKALRKAEEEAQKSGVFVVDIEDSSLFEEDLDWKEPREEYPGLRDPERVRKMYIAACDMLGIVASNRFLRSVQSGRVVAGYQGFGPLGAKAVAISLVTGLTVTELQIPGNMLGAQGMYFMAKLIQGNYVIKVLDICDNNLGREGAKVLANAIKENHSLQEIRAAGNKFDDKTGAYFADAIQVNTQIKQLDLSRNMLSMDGAIAIGKAMGEYTL
ncbi:leucine-rich repeat-containing protein 74A-like [Littorina saxatilis]|uniref:leucine-rich repeat-containing protein 74A-like n=1 Tax=Littorina saxatilis TaxID=31220 RepID=UPI0038B52C31